MPARHAVRLLAGGVAGAVSATLVLAGAGMARADTVGYPAQRSTAVTEFLPTYGSLGLAPDGTAYLAGITDEEAAVAEVFAPHTNPRNVPEMDNSADADDVALDRSGDVFTLALADPQGDGTYQPAVKEFAPGTTSPVTRIFYPVDAQQPVSIAVGPDGEIALSDSGIVRIYAPDATGFSIAVRTIDGSPSGRSYGRIAFGPDGQLWALGAPNGESTVYGFSPTAAGDATPSTVLQGSHVKVTENSDLTIDSAGHLYLTRPGEVVVYAQGASGNPSPERKLTGKVTRIGYPYSVAVNAKGDIAVVEYTSTSSFTLRVFRTLFPTRPSQVRSVTVTGKSSAHRRVVGWKRPVPDGGRTIRSYRIVVSKANKTVKAATLAASRRHYGVSRSVLPSGKLSVSVRAVTSKGRSVPTATEFTVHR